MAQGLGKARTHLPGGLEELVGEVLCKKGKQDIGALGGWNELPSQQESLGQELNIRQLLLPWLGGWKRTVDA